MRLRLHSFFPISFSRISDQWIVALHQFRTPLHGPGYWHWAINSFGHRRWRWRLLWERFMLKTWEFSQNSPIIPGVWAELVNFSRTERTKTHGISLGGIIQNCPEIWSPKTRSQVAIEVIELASMVAIKGEKLGRWNPSKPTCFRLSDKLLERGRNLSFWSDVFLHHGFLVIRCSALKGFLQMKINEYLGFTMRFVGCDHLSDTLPEAIFLPLKKGRAPKGKE